MTVTDDPGAEKCFTAADVLEIVLAAYERGLIDAAAHAGRDHWNCSDEARQLRQARHTTEMAAMKHYATTRYQASGRPAGYDYRGGEVDWETGMPPGTACAWLRRRREARSYDLAGGNP